MNRTVVYEGNKLTLTRRLVRTPEGLSVVKEVVEHRGAAVIIPMLADDGVCMVENERVAVGEMLLELPAGTLDEGEKPEATAARELEEETGYRAGRLTKLAEFYPSPGILSERMHLYLADDLTQGTMHLDPGEQVRPVVVAWADAVRMALDGRIKDAKTLVGLLLWDRLRTERGRKA